MILSFYKFGRPVGNSFYFYPIWNIQNLRLFHLSEDYQCWVNLWNLGMWRHAPYNSEQELIIRLYLRRELSIISIISFIHSVQGDLSQVFIEPIGFTLESIPKDITLRHCCGLGFCVKCLPKWAAKESELLLFATFCAISWKCFSIPFLECFGYFLHRSICTYFPS